jgi:hypothetical protein
MSLKNDTFADLKNLTFALIGREYEDTSASFGRLKSLWNFAAKKAYRQTLYWERFLVIGEERKLIDGNSVPRDEEGKDSIDTFIRIYPYNPEKSRGGNFKFLTDAIGATITNTKSKSHSVDLYDSPDTGENYYLQPSDSESGSTVFVSYKKDFAPDYGNAGDAEKIPSELMPYMAHLAAYTWQRSVQQQSDADSFSISMQLVNSILEDELAKISDQNVGNSYLAKNIQTNYNNLII